MLVFLFEVIRVVFSFNAFSFTYVFTLNLIRINLKQNNGLLKDRFIEAIVCGELGSIEDRGIVFTLKEFKSIFVDIKIDYINYFLPAATIEPGRKTMTCTKFLFRVHKGVSDSSGVAERF